MSTNRPVRFTKKQLADARRKLATEEAQFAAQEARQAAREHIIDERRARTRKKLQARVFKIWTKVRVPVLIALVMVVATYGYWIGRISACEEEQRQLAIIEYEKLPIWVLQPVSYEEALVLVPNAPADVLQDVKRDDGYVVGDMYEESIRRLGSQEISMRSIMSQARAVRDYYWALDHSSKQDVLDSFSFACKQASWFGNPIIPTFDGANSLIQWPPPYFADESLEP